MAGPRGKRPGAMAASCHVAANVARRRGGSRNRSRSMSLLTWLGEQKLAEWVQGMGSLAAAGAAVGIALRQERLERQRDIAAGKLRAQVLAAAIAPVLHDMQAAVRIRNGLLQTSRRLRDGEEPP